MQLRHAVETSWNLPVTLSSLEGQDIDQKHALQRNEALAVHH